MDVDIDPAPALGELDVPPGQSKEELEGEIVVLEGKLAGPKVRVYMHICIRYTYLFLHDLGGSSKTIVPKNIL